MYSGKGMVNYKYAFIVLSIGLGIAMPYLSLDFGMTEDARVHHEHGKRILDYFKGTDQTAALPPFDAEGNFFNISASSEALLRGMNGFGGFFDLLCQVVHSFVPKYDPYAVRHALSAILGFLMFLFCGLIGKTIGGWRLGLFALLLTALAPVLFGQSMNSPKDIPFAAFYIFSVFHLIKLLQELPKISVQRSILLLINISILINIRLIGLVFLGYLFLFPAIWWWLNWKKQKQDAKLQPSQSVNLSSKAILQLGFSLTIIALLSYLATSIFWPYMHTAPFVGPLDLFLKVKAYKGFVSTQLFEGLWRNSYNMPWYYPFKALLYIATPIPIFMGFLLSPLLFLKKYSKTQLFSISLLCSGLLPIILIILGGANSYDHARQFLFVIPPLIVIAAYAWLCFLEYIQNPFLQRVFTLVLGILCLQPLRFMIRNHPMQAAYFSPLVGGVPGAYGKYELDFLGIGIKPAIDWLAQQNENAEQKPSRVRMYYGEQLKAKYYLDQIPQLTYVAVPEKSNQWDYGIVMLTESKFDQKLALNWPPKNTIHQVSVEDTPLCFVVKNTYKPTTLQELETKLQSKPNAADYVQLSLLYFQKADFVKSILAAQQAISLAPNNHLAYNNLCSAYNRLFMFAEAAQAGQKALDLFPGFALAANNLKIARLGINKRREKRFSLQEYQTLSLGYFQLKKFDRCIAVSQELLQKYPNTSRAYNNICSSHNELGNYQLAIAACRKALTISPNFDLAKNNLLYAEGRF